MKLVHKIYIITSKYTEESSYRAVVLSVCIYIVFTIFYEAFFIRNFVCCFIKPRNQLKFKK